MTCRYLKLIGFFSFAFCFFLYVFLHLFPAFSSFFSFPDAFSLFFRVFSKSSDLSLFKTASIF